MKQIGFQTLPRGKSRSKIQQNMTTNNVTFINGGELSTDIVCCNGICSLRISARMFAILARSLSHSFLEDTGTVALAKIEQKK